MPASLPPQNARLSAAAATGITSRPAARIRHAEEKGRCSCARKLPRRDGPNRGAAGGVRQVIAISDRLIAISALYLASHGEAVFSTAPGGSPVVSPRQPLSSAAAFPPPPLRAPAAQQQVPLAARPCRVGSRRPPRASLSSCSRCPRPRQPSPSRRRGTPASMPTPRTGGCATGSAASAGQSRSSGRSDARSKTPDQSHQLPSHPRRALRRRSPRRRGPDGAKISAKKSINTRTFGNKCRFFGYSA